jgi:hypothetical protein
MTRTYSYVVEHDVGFAPNPFWGICTLANCKPEIRRTAKLGDRILGTGSTSANLQGHLIYWMIVDEIITFDEYWGEARFRLKRPVLNGSEMQQFGDNIYSTGPGGQVRQVDSFHSEANGVVSNANLVRDTGRTNRVLIAKEFGYFGKAAPAIPNGLGVLVKKGPGHKCKFSVDTLKRLDEWLHQLDGKGLRGEPVRW